MQILTTQLTEDGLTVFEEQIIEMQPASFSSGDLATMMGDTEACKRFFFAELPPDTRTGFAPFARRQICVCLSGQLELILPDESSTVLVAGSVWRTENLSGEGHSYAVTGDAPARVLVVQLD